jgi:uncharacterized protein
VRLLFAFVTAATFSILASTFQVRADAAAVLLEAMAADNLHDYATELKLVRPLAEQGNALAQGMLGAMYHDGLGIQKDYAEAFRWFLSGAEQGDAAAQWGLGLIYRRGDGVPADNAEARRWYRKSAEQGFAAAEYEFGQMYFRGQGLPQDWAEAVKWWRKAAEQGHDGAQYALGLMYFRGQGVPQDWAEAVKWWRKAAEQGDASAQTKLGLMYESSIFEGLGLPKNPQEAFRWYRKAAEQGDAEAQARLGMMYERGQSVPENLAEAFRLYRKSAEQGNGSAQVMLGLMYERGVVVPKDNAKALHWYREAAEQGFSAGQGLLGLMIERGNGTPRDYVQAYTWYNIAAAAGNKTAARSRDSLERQMTPQQIAEAQQRTAAWRPVQPGEQQSALGKSGDPWAAFNPQPVPETAEPAREAPSGKSGTAFFIGDGALLTNAHVVKGCSDVSIGPPGQRTNARVFARDEENDLALLRAATRPSAIAALRLSIRQGEAISAYGYPLPGLLASGGNLTTGNVTALSGIGDDSRFLQISAPVQPGNSGGPLLDATGNVVGIVKGKLDATKVASAIGDVPQNVNFAIKASVIATFLEGNSIHYVSGVSTSGRSPADIAENARRFTVPVECRGSTQ